ncbi:hypothetical protein ACQJBY_030201 [Aegilops geniculata]
MDAGSDGDGLCFPYDVLLDILRRLSGRDVAASQCVCRLWRDIIDVHRLSLEHYFPRRAFPGLFVNKIGCRPEMSFIAPSATRFGRPVYCDMATVCQSCNGLLLLEDGDDYYYVLNPATARYAHVPLPTAPWYRSAICLAFDPAVSLHYNVFLFQEGGLLKVKPLPTTQMQGEDLPLKQVQLEVVDEPTDHMLPMLVYSSYTGRWENTEFTPGRCAPGHLYNVVARPPETHGRVLCSSEYWHGSLYMHCHNSILVILRPAKVTYDMVQLPGKPCSARSYYDDLPTNSVLASYGRGIHYVATNGSQVRVWMLTESIDHQLDWTLAHDISLNLDCHMIRTLKIQPKVKWRIVGSRGGPVSLTDNDVEDKKLNGAGAYGSEYSWNSDEDNFIDVGEGAAHQELRTIRAYCGIMGFHPYKNALILLLNSVMVVYHLDTSRMQYLSNEHELVEDSEQHACCVNDSFVYRPCYKDVLSAGKLSTSS